MDLSVNLNPMNLEANSDILKKSQAKQRELEAAQDFEALFIQSSLKQMRPKLDGGLFNDGLAVDVFYQFMDEAIAQEISRSSDNFGLAQQLIKEQF